MSTCSHAEVDPLYTMASHRTRIFSEPSDVLHFSSEVYSSSSLTTFIEALPGGICWKEFTFASAWKAAVRVQCRVLIRKPTLGRYRRVWVTWPDIHRETLSDSLTLTAERSSDMTTQITCWYCAHIHLQRNEWSRAKAWQSNTKAEQSSLLLLPSHNLFWGQWSGRRSG